MASFRKSNGTESGFWKSFLPETESVPVSNISIYSPNASDANATLKSVSSSFHHPKKYKAAILILLFYYKTGGIWSKILHNT